MTLTPKQLSTLRHMLGINDPSVRMPRPYRNYAAVTPDNSEFLALEAAGAVERYEPRIASEYHYYRCTEAGELAALRSHRSIRWARGRRRYAKFLEIRDALHDLTFRDFLTDPQFREARTQA